MLTVRQAQQSLIDSLQPIRQVEHVPLLKARTRVLARDIFSTIAVPNADNASMDGYCFRYADFERNSQLNIHGRIAAGHVGGALGEGQAARIFTGAPLPAGADTVVRQEWCEVVDNKLIMTTRPNFGDSVRKAGEDIAVNACVLRAGTRLSAQHLGQAASIGLTQLPVVRRPRVAIFCTGDELQTAGKPLGPGQLYNSNQLTLHSLLDMIGCEVIDLGIVPDNLNQTMQVLRDAATKSDFIVSSGGVSVGEADFVKTALEQMGTIEFWRVAVKPGKPIVYGHVNRSDLATVPMIGLPGNPVSSFVTFLLFVRPCLLKLQGASHLWPRPTRVQMAKAFNKPDERNEFLRVRINEDGKAEYFDNLSSGVLSSLTWADGLVDNPPGHAIAADEWVDYYTIESFFV